MSGELKVGDMVRYDCTGNPNYGIIVQTYWDQGELDCYVAFWGDKIPTMDETKPPTERPCILRYYAASLEKVESAVG